MEKKIHVKFGFKLKKIIWIHMMFTVSIDLEILHGYGFILDREEKNTTKWKMNEKKNI